MAKKAVCGNEVSDLGLSIGLKLRHARLGKRMRLEDLASQIECSKSMLSKIENGRATPSLTMLHKLATALGTNVSKLVEKIPASGFVTRFGERPIVSRSGEDATDISFELLTPAPGPSLYQASIHSIPPGSHSDGAIVHEGEDFGYVLSGAVELCIGEETYLVKSGDTFAFPSHIPHSYSNKGNETANVLWLNTPATF